MEKRDLVMKNRRWKRTKNGKFFCFHKWQINTDVGPDWDLTVGLRLLCKCMKCGKLKEVNNYLIGYVPIFRIKQEIKYL